MVVRFLTIFIVLMTLGASMQTQAGSQAQPKSQAPKANPLGEDPGPVYTDVIRKWMEATGFAKEGSDIVVDSLVSQMQHDPKMKGIVNAELISDLKQYFYELFVSDQMAKNLAIVYSQHFSIDEMEDLIKFYKSPTGIKLVKTNPEIMQKSQEIGMQLLKSHENEYMKIIAKYRKKGS